MENAKRYSRQIAFFGEMGQEKLSLINAVVVGVGGVGSHVAQQLAFLGVKNITLIDEDPLDDTNLNRLIGVRDDDPIGTLKVDIVERLILSINPSINISKIPYSFISTAGFDALKQATFVFGCVDNDGARLVLNQFCVAYELPYIDIASDVMPDGTEYGGRVISVINNLGCVYCWGEIDTDQAAQDLESPEARKDREKIYGIDKTELGNTGPSVVSLNGVVASIAVTEFMLHVTGKREAQLFLCYRGSRGIVTKRNEENDCYYCKNTRGKKDNAGLYRYLKTKT